MAHRLGYFGNNLQTLDINAVDRSGFTALMRAIQDNNDSLVSDLFANPDIDISYQLEEGVSALTLALDSANLSITARLLRIMPHVNMVCLSSYYLSDTLAEALALLNLAELCQSSALFSDLFNIESTTDADRIILLQKVLSYAVVNGSNANAIFITKVFGLDSYDDLSKYQDVRFFIAAMLRLGKFDIYHIFIEYYADMYAFESLCEDAYFFSSSADAYYEKFYDNLDVVAKTHPFLIALEKGYTWLLDDFFNMNEDNYLVFSIHEYSNNILDLLSCASKDVLESLLANIAFLDSIGIDSNSLFLSAVQSSNVELLALLLANDTIEVPDNLLMWALAVEDGSLDCVKLILASGRVFVPMTFALDAAINENILETCDDMDNSNMLLAIINQYDYNLSKDYLCSLIDPELDDEQSLRLY